MCHGLADVLLQVRGALLEPSNLLLKDVRRRRVWRSDTLLLLIKASSYLPVQKPAGARPQTRDVPFLEFFEKQKL